MPAFNIGESDVIGLSGNLRKKEKIDEKRSVWKTGRFWSNTYPEKTETLELNIFSETSCLFV